MRISGERWLPSQLSRLAGNAEPSGENMSVAGGETDGLIGWRGPLRETSNQSAEESATPENCRRDQD
jgi:hypothetical protein